jgi:O-antigen ligase
MNKFNQRLLLFLFPFYPFWAYFLTFFTNKNIAVFANIFLLPIAAYLFITSKKKLPKYLVFFLLFTVFHLSSIFINNIFSKETNKFYTLLADANILACALLLIVESTRFDLKFITRMNKNIFIIVIISLIVSIIQIKNPSFFFNVIQNEDDWGLTYLDQNRNFSIYSWVDYHTIGITFPFLIAILLSQYNTGNRKFQVFLIIISGILVSFLSRYRFMMVAAVVVCLQPIFVNKKTLINKLSLIFLFLGCIFLAGFVAEKSGLKISEVINNRILESETDFRSARARITSFDVFILKFPEHPWLGVGPATRDDVIALLNGESPIIHIGYLSYLYYYGIFGALIFFISLGYLLKSAWDVGIKHRFWGSFFGLVTFCIANIVFVFFDLSDMGIVLSVIYIKYFNSQSPESDISQLENSGSKKA